MTNTYPATKQVTGFMLHAGQFIAHSPLTGDRMAQVVKTESGSVMTDVTVRYIDDRTTEEIAIGNDELVSIAVTFTMAQYMDSIKDAI